MAVSAQVFVSPSTLVRVGFFALVYYLGVRVGLDLVISQGFFCTVIAIVVPIFLWRVSTGDLRSHEKALRRNGERLRAILDSPVVGVVAIDEMGVAQSFNPGPGRIFRYGADEVPGKGVTVLTPEPHRSRHRPRLANGLGSGKPKSIGRGREVEGRRHGQTAACPTHFLCGSRR